MELEYVASGCAALKVFSKTFKADEGRRQHVSGYFKKLNTCRPGHKFSTLFNALMEKNIGKYMHEGYHNSLYRIHADSGGLQEVTLGKKIKDKREIFKAQADYSDVAMSFDKIPVYLPDGAATIQGSGIRLYSQELLVPCARESGENLREQLRYFAKIESKSKVFMILQGNSFENYQIWLNEMWDVIKDEDLSYIGGIASAAAALGSGPLEDYKRAYTVANLDYPTELIGMPIHILGVGSIRRLLPNLLIPSNKDRHISYDSTSHTKAMFSAAYYCDYVLHSYGADVAGDAKYIEKKFNPILEEHGFGTLTIDDIVKIKLTKGGDRLENFPDGDYTKFIDVSLRYFSAMILHFYKDCDIVKSNPEEFYLSRQPKQVPAIKQFIAIRDHQDYGEWLNTTANLLPSRSYPIKETQPYDLF